MRQAGCAQTNPGHPDLLAVLAEGGTPEALADTVREALGSTPPKSRPFTWAIATLRGRLAEAAHPRTNGALTHATPRPRESLVDRAAARAAHIFANENTDADGGA